MTDCETTRKSTHDAVISKQFTRIPGLPTWEQKESFILEASELAMSFTVTYPWAGDHGLLAEILGQAKYLAKTGKNYVPPVRPPPSLPILQL